MNAQQSNLSAPQYGYDFVVGTTQGSINATMKMFMSGLTEPEVTICYVADAQGNPTPIDYATLIRNANGSDPFTIPNGTDPATNQDLKNLYAARFMVGFKAKIGLPPGIAPANMPDIVALGANTASVSYNLMCSEFIVVQYNPATGWAPASWFSESQPAGSPWLFNSKVDLRLSTTDQSAYSTLPPDVQKAIKNLGGNAFSVQQLLFDLDNAALESIPTISGVDTSSNLYMVLQKDFLGKYFSTLKKNGQPVLGCAVHQSSSDPSTLVLTDLNLEVVPYLGTNGQPIMNPTLDQKNLATLNYLCAANGNRLPPPTPFNWNWVEPNQESDFQGVIAINRNTFADYFKNKLQWSIPRNCFLSYVDVSFHDGRVWYSWNLTPGQAPNLSLPATGATVLHYSFGSNAEDSDALGEMQLKPSYDVTVSFSGNTITIVQHLVIFLNVRSLATSAGGNIVDKTITDTYTISVDADGSLNTTLASGVIDVSEHPGTNGFLNFFTGLNDIINSISDWTRNFVGTSFNDIPIDTARGFVFPGGRTFTFKDVAFSDNQDLISHITYVNPN